MQTKELTDYSVKADDHKCDWRFGGVSTIVDLTHPKEVTISVAILGDFLHFGQVFKAFGNH